MRPAKSQHRPLPFWLVISLVFGLSLLGLLTRRGELVALAIPLVAYLAMSIWRSPDQLALAVTRRLCEAGQVMGIRVLDHIIIGENEFYSFAENGQL